MLIEAHGRFQITIPSEIVKKLDIKEGEQLEVVEKTADFFYVLSISFLYPFYALLLLIQKQKLCVLQNLLKKQMVIIKMVKQRLIRGV